MISKAQFKHLRSLKQKKYRQQEKKFLTEGWRLVQEAVNSNFSIEYVLITKEIFHTHDPTRKEVLQQLRRKRIEIHEIDARDFESISDTVTSQGIVALVLQKNFFLEDVLRHSLREKSIIVALDAVAEPGNLGTIIRTCDWFGIQGILLGEESVELYNTKVVRSTMGSIFHLPIVEHVNLKNDLPPFRRLGFKIFVTDLEAKRNYYEANFGKKCILVFGNEAWGVSSEIKTLADERISIPQFGKAESLNVSIACGIILARVALEILV